MLEFRLSDSYCMSKKKKYPKQSPKTCTHLQSSSYTPDGGDRNELCGEVATHYHDGRGQWFCERHWKKVTTTTTTTTSSGSDEEYGFDSGEYGGICGD